MKIKLLSFLLLSLAFHCFYLFSFGQFWDGAIYAHFLTTGESESFLRPWIENGRPVTGWIFFVLGQLLGLEIGFRFLILFLVGFAGFLTYRITAHFRFLSERFALFTGCLIVALPYHHVYASFTATFYLLFFPFFLLALDLARGTSVRHKAFATLCLVVSFFSEAFAVPAVLIPAYVALTSQRPFELKTWIKSYLHNVQFVLLPLLFVLTLSWLQPVSGHYSSARELDFSPLKIFSGLLSYFETFLNTPSVGFQTARTLLGLTAGIGLAGLLIRKSTRRSLDLKLLAGLGLSILFFLFGSLPFVLASRLPGIEGWNSRHFAALLLPMAWIFTFWAAFWLTPFATKAVETALVCVATVGFGLASLRAELVWESRRALEQGIVRKLRTDALKRANRVYIYPPLVPVFREDLRIYEWNLLLYSALGDLKRVLSVEPRPGEPHNWKEAPEVRAVQETHALIDPLWKTKRDCGAQLFVLPASKLGWKVGLRALWLRTTRNANQHLWEESLSDVRVSFEPECSKK